MVLNSNMVLTTDINMTYLCPECTEQGELAAEVHGCWKCGETYCPHFMKETGKDALCWVCGSEKVKPPTGMHDKDDFDMRKFA